MDDSDKDMAALKLEQAPARKFDHLGLDNEGLSCYYIA
jgi:hypothetical protein